MQSSEIRTRFLNFFKERSHAVVPSSSLVPSDPSVLLTTAGMQQFKPYFTGEADAVRDFGSKSTVSVQKSFRTSDIDEVGDERHLTFFEMLGNFSFGGYFKKEAITLAHEFMTREMGLTISYVTIFAGKEEIGVQKDEESRDIWRGLGVTDVREEGIEDVFWGPTGSAGPCGPTTEIYCKNAAGQDIEVWNIVFNQFFYPGTREELLAGAPGKKLEPLASSGVDTGMGLERLAMISQNVATIFETDLFASTLALLPPTMPERDKRVIADHARAICLLLADGVRPSNKGAGYVLRRLMRRLLVTGNGQNYNTNYNTLLQHIVSQYCGFYPELQHTDVLQFFTAEQKQFSKTLVAGLRELAKLGGSIDAVSAFNLYETYGLPYDVIKDKVPGLSKEAFEAEFKKHQDVSRVGAGAKFTGGLADHELATVKLHTAHHLLLAALQRVLGAGVKQRGSNITQERLRLDFSHPEKLTDEQRKQVEDLVNEKIRENLVVERREMKKEEAERLGAEHEFGAKYGDVVSVYIIDNFSKEFCGGPHVARTGELGVFKIVKEEAVSAGVRRIRGVLTP